MLFAGYLVQLRKACGLIFLSKMSIDNRMSLLRPKHYRRNALEKSYIFLANDSCQLTVSKREIGLHWGPTNQSTSS